MEAILLAALLVAAWIAWEATARSHEQRARAGVLDYLAPDRPPRIHDRDARLRPVPRARVVRAAGSAAIWTLGTVVSAVAWGVVPGTLLAGAIGALHLGDLVAVVRRRRFAAAFEAEKRSGPPGRDPTT